MWEKVNPMSILKWFVWLEENVQVFQIELFSEMWEFCQHDLLCLVKIISFREIINFNRKKNKTKKHRHYTGQRADILPVALTPSAFPSNTSASEETAGCSLCPPDWQPFPDWSLCINKYYISKYDLCMHVCVPPVKAIFSCVNKPFSTEPNVACYEHILYCISTSGRGRQVGNLLAFCVLTHLWWRSPCPGNCTCIWVTLPSSSYGNWWGPGQTEASRGSPPSPPLWTAGSLNKAHRAVRKSSLIKKNKKKNALH